MNDQLTDVLERAAGPVPPAPSVLMLVKAGERRRRRKVIAGGVTTVAGLALAVGLAGSLPMAQPEIDPVGTAPANPAGSIVRSSDGTAPLLPVNAEPMDLETRPLAGLGPEVREAAVASDGRVAVRATGSDLAVAHPDDAAPTPLALPDGIDRCGSMAFDAAGHLWALCYLGSSEDALQATLLRYGPDDVEPTSYDVTEFVRAVSPTALDATLWVVGREVRAVVSTDPSPEEGQPSLQGSSSAVTLVADGDLQTVDGASIRELPSLPVDTRSQATVSWAPGVRVTDESSAEGRSIEIAWLTHNATAVINPPNDDWIHEGTHQGSAFIGSTITLTHELASSDRTIVYGVVADGQGTTSVMRLPTAAEGRPNLSSAPSPPTFPVAMLLTAPDGSVHLLSAEESSLTTAEVLPAAS